MAHHEVLTGLSESDHALLICSLGRLLVYWALACLSFSASFTVGCGCLLTSSSCVEIYIVTRLRSLPLPLSRQVASSGFIIQAAAQLFVVFVVENVDDLVVGGLELWQVPRFRQTLDRMATLNIQFLAHSAEVFKIVLQFRLFQVPARILTINLLLFFVMATLVQDALKLCLWTMIGAGGRQQFPRQLVVVRYFGVVLLR